MLYYLHVVMELKGTASESEPFIPIRMSGHALMLTYFFKSGIGGSRIQSCFLQTQEYRVLLFHMSLLYCYLLVTHAMP